MKRFLQTKPGLLSLIGFTLVMAFMLHRVLSTGKDRTPASPPNTFANNSAPIPKTPALKLDSESTPLQTPLPEPSRAEKPSQPQDGKVLGSTLQTDLLYLDRVRESGEFSRTDRDREGLPITRRRTANPGSSARKQQGAPAEDSASVSSGKSLRLSGRVREAITPTGTLSAQVPDNQIISATSPSLSVQPTVSVPTPETLRFVPYGRPIKCELVFTIDSTMEETPFVGLVVEPVHNNGLLVIPAGTELHGIARPDRLRDRIFSGRDWVLVLPREASAPNGRQLKIKGLALDRIEPQASGLTWGITDGSYGLQGSVIRTMESAEIKRFAATFVSAAALTLQERQTTSRGGRSVTSTPANAALQGIASSLEGLAREIAAEIERNGVFIRIAGGKQFYFYPLQIIAPDRANIPLSP